MRGKILQEKLYNLKSPLLELEKKAVAHEIIKRFMQVGVQHEIEGG